MSAAPISVADNWIAAGPADRLDRRPIVTYRVGAHDVIVFYDDGQLYACERACPHEQADLCLGHVSEGRLHCPRHLASFGLQDGSISRGWQSRDLRRYPVRVVDGVVWIDVGDIPA